MKGRPSFCVDRFTAGLDVQQQCGVWRGTHVSATLTILHIMSCM